MNQHLKIPQPWTHMAVFLCLFGGALLLYSLVGSVLVEILGIEQEVLKGAYPEPSDQNAINKLKILQAVSSLIIFMLPAWIFPRIIFTGRYLYFIGFKKADHSNMYLLAVLSVLMALPVVFWLGEMNRLIPLPSWLTSMERNAGKQIELFLHHRTPIDITVNVLLLALIPAFGEELCFRSVLQRIIIQIAGRPVYGIFITAFLFSALHMQFEGFLPRMLLGLILGALYWYSGSIWTSVLAHFTNNAVQVIAASYSPELIDNTPSIPVLLVISSGIGLIGILYYYAKETRQSFNRTYYPEKWGRDAPYLAD